MSPETILLRVAQAIAAADHGIPGNGDRARGLWPSLGPDAQARYMTIARAGVEEYLAAVAEARTS